MYHLINIESRKRLNLCWYSSRGVYFLGSIHIVRICFKEGFEILLTHDLLLGFMRLVCLVSATRGSTLKLVLICLKQGRCCRWHSFSWVWFVSLLEWCKLTASLGSYSRLLWVLIFLILLWCFLNQLLQRRWGHCLKLLNLKAWLSLSGRFVRWINFLICNSVGSCEFHARDVFSHLSISQSRSTLSLILLVITFCTNIFVDLIAFSIPVLWTIILLSSILQCFFCSLMSAKKCCSSLWNASFLTLHILRGRYCICIAIAVCVTLLVSWFILGGNGCCLLFVVLWNSDLRRWHLVWWTSIVVRCCSLVGNWWRNLSLRRWCMSISSIARSSAGRWLLLFCFSQLVG